jgi:hypothetical protein
MSRWGGFSNGRKLFTNNTSWDLVRSASSTTETKPTSPNDFDYTTAQGIWNLNSTYQFPQKPPRTYNLGLSPSLFSISGSSAVWSQRTVNITQYAGATVRLVFRYLNGNGFYGDIQLDYINMNGNIYSFENTGHSFQTSTAGETSYNTVSWVNLAVGEVNARWNVDTGGTPSASTGLATAAAGTYYVYAETTAPGNTLNYNFWLRSPQISLGSTSPTLSFYEARSGSTIGTLHVHLDVIA